MAKPVLVIGNKNYSSWSLCPWLLLKQFGIDFEEIRIPLFTEQMPQLMSEHTPCNKVPVIKDGDLAVWDSLAVCEYINLRFLDGKGWPEDLQLMSLGRAAVAEMHSGFLVLRHELPMNVRRSYTGFKASENAQKDIDRIIALWQQLLERSGGPWLLGEFSIADAFYAPVASRFNTYGIELPENLQAYVDQVLALETYQEWLRDARAEKEVIPEEEVEL
ncbi:glutathione S-transferase family protein [Oceanospirillum sanctuarii]|uniref:glutathione S-transferase family protein n=1 Tax=Oceanospirillum sanctuarii TaxID=1434821 RepID=UPI000A3847D8|nr:glutathione S-transferase family protein [Oceanospirillum sanctuarii]